MLRLDVHDIDRTIFSANNFLFQCPFHGIIVPRDEMGKCINPEDEQKWAAKAEKEKQETPDWQDPQLLKEIQVRVSDVNAYVVSGFPLFICSVPYI